MHTVGQENEQEFLDACARTEIEPCDMKMMQTLLEPLRNKSEETCAHYLHMLRVGILSMKIGRFLYHEEKPLLIAGALHDIGKLQSPPEVLGKTEAWHNGDAARMRSHVMDGYRMLRGRFDFIAEIVVLHHRFQEQAYPPKLPFPLHDYDESTRLLIMEYGRILALADHYDALHRCDKGECLTKLGVKKKMLEGNPDRKKLIMALYEAEIF